MKNALKPLLIAAFAMLAPLSFAQQNSDIDAVKKRAALNSAKADLEEARKKRDMAVAARWKDRETANQERELFNEKYNESKEKVDALMSERARLFEDVRVAREDLAQVKLQAEKARAEYLSLAAGPERANLPLPVKSSWKMRNLFSDLPWRRETACAWVASMRCRWQTPLISTACIRRH